MWRTDEVHGAAALRRVVARWPDVIGALGSSSSGAQPLAAVVVRELMPARQAHVLGMRVQQLAASASHFVHTDTKHARIGAKPYTRDQSSAFGAWAHEQKLTGAVEALHGAIRTLAGKRRVAAGEGYGEPGSFSVFAPGNQYSAHIDTLHPSSWYDYCARNASWSDSRLGGGTSDDAARSERKQAWLARRNAPKTRAYPDALRFDAHYSAILVLHPTPGVDVTAWAAHWDVLRRDCTAGAPRGDGTNPVNVRFGTEGWARSAAAARAPAANLSLRAGDAYIFSSHNVHSVWPVAGPRPRVTYSTFMGADKDEVRLWGY